MRIARTTRQLTREWLASAEPVALTGIKVPAVVITSSFPVVAVAGLRRPRLVIAKSVLASCTPEELQAILAHEQGHLDRHDNLGRLMLAVAPDVLAWLPASGRLFTAWCRATEEAADDDAARAGANGRLCLASALVKVARLASGPPAGSLMPASALYSGDSLDGRIRRLLEPRADAGEPRRHAVGTLVAVASVAIASALALQGLYGVIETAIRVLP
jgi:D-alanyl-D-alanine endopeptidase (penicillin-binding protein 7)